MPPVGVLGLEPIAGLRVVATPAALDAAVAGLLAFRIAADEALVVTGNPFTIDDPHAIVEEERGFLGGWISYAEFDEKLRPHIEWTVPDTRPWLGQGLVASVPLKLYFESHGVMVIVSRGLAHELQERVS